MSLAAALWSARSDAGRAIDALTGLGGRRKKAGWGGEAMARPLLSSFMR